MVFSKIAKIFLRRSLILPLKLKQLPISCRIVDWRIMQVASNSTQMLSKANSLQIEVNTCARGPDKTFPFFAINSDYRKAPGQLRNSELCGRHFGTPEGVGLQTSNIHPVLLPRTGTGNRPVFPSRRFHSFPVSVFLFPLWRDPDPTLHTACPAFPSRIYSHKVRLGNSSMSTLFHSSRPIVFPLS